MPAGHEVALAVLDGVAEKDLQFIVSEQVNGRLGAARITEVVASVIVPVLAGACSISSGCGACPDRFAAVFAFLAWGALRNLLLPNPDNLGSFTSELESSSGSWRFPPCGVHIGCSGGSEFAVSSSGTRGNATDSGSRVTLLRVLREHADAAPKR